MWSHLNTNPSVESGNSEIMRHGEVAYQPPIPPSTPSPDIKKEN